MLEPLDAFAPTDLVWCRCSAGEGSSAGDAQPLVALPFNRSTPIAYYNKHVFTELGLSPPTTWTELRAVAARGTLADRSRWGFGARIDWWFWLALVGHNHDCFTISSK